MRYRTCAKVFSLRNPYTVLQFWTLYVPFTLGFSLVLHRISWWHSLSKVKSKHFLDFIKKNSNHKNQDDILLFLHFTSQIVKCEVSPVKLIHIRDLETDLRTPRSDFRCSISPPLQRRLQMRPRTTTFHLWRMEIFSLHTWDLLSKYLYPSEKFRYVTWNFAVSTNADSRRKAKTLKNVHCFTILYSGLSQIAIS